MRVLSGAPGDEGAGRWRRRRSLCVLLVGLVLPAGLSGQVPPPDEIWYTFDTRHFQLIYPPGLEELAGRAAERGERALERLTGFGTVPDLRIQMILTDHMDFSNGTATTIPYPRIVLWARPPMDGPGPIPFDDWMELLVTHELVHVLHTEMVGPLGRAGRSIFGRAPLIWPLFPAFALPSWAIEGVAVQAESALTDGGRLHGTRLEGVVRAAALEDRVERVDQVVGTSGVFPGGERPYVYGGLFHEYLAHRFGSEALGEFFRRQAGRLNPYRLDATAREVFGVSLSALHAEWRSEVAGEAGLRSEQVVERSLAPVPRMLTRGERMAIHPRFDPVTGDLLYARVDGRSEPAWVRRPGPAAGGGEGEERIRSLRTATAASVTSGGAWVMPQPEFVDRYRVRSDIWRVDPEGGGREVLTRGLRVTALDTRPTDDHMVAVLDEAGSHRLVLLDPGGREVREFAAADAGVLWGQPRWSPDGRRFAVGRWSAGGYREIMIFDDEGSEISVVESGSAPAAGASWSPDGNWLIWTSERSGVANLYVAALDPEGRAGPVRQLSDLLTAAAFPEVSPDGSRVVFSLLRSDGWDLAELPFRPEEAFDPLPLDPRFVGDGAGAMGGGGHLRSIGGEPRRWSPASTLRPRHWTPWAARSELLDGVRVLPLVLGAESGASDAVGRHRWEARIGAPVGGGVGRWEGLGLWEWAGLGDPVLTGRLEQGWVTLGRGRVVEEGMPAESGREILVIARERSAALGVGTVRPGLRWSRAGTVELRAIRQDRSFLDLEGARLRDGLLPRRRRDLAEGSLHLGINSARAYPLSVGAQDGLSVLTRFRVLRELALPDGAAGVRGRDAAFEDVVAVFRGFVPLGRSGGRVHDARNGPPVGAVRLSAGGARGPGAGTGHFGVGGSEGNLFPVRGVSRGARGGTRVWAAAGEIRAPLARVHRGWGLLPFHLDQLAGAVFVDAGGAPGGGNDRSVIASTGLELSLSQSILFHGAERFRVGVAVPFAGERGVAAYAAAGWAF